MRTEKTFQLHLIVFSKCDEMPCSLLGSPFVNAIVQKGFDERHAYIGGMFGAGNHSYSYYFFHCCIFVDFSDFVATMHLWYSVVD